MRGAVFGSLTALAMAVAQTPQKAPGAGVDPASLVASNQAGSNEVRMNFRGAQLSEVLEYLSDAAGFIINQEAKPEGTVDAWSKEPLTRGEAVELLNSALRKNGYAVMRNGRILTIVRPQEARGLDLEVISGSNPEAVPKTEELVTQIIPVRHASATQLVNNLQPLLPSSASLSVNDGANSIIMVATQRDVRRILRVVKVLDDSLASVSSLKVFALKFADPQQVATVIQQLYAPAATSSTRGGPGGSRQTFGPGGFGGPPGMEAFGLPGGQGQGSGQSASGPAAMTRVVAAADETSGSVIVSAPADTLQTITQLVSQLDKPATEVTEIRVFKFINADANEMADQLAQLFPNDTRNSTGQARGPVRFGASPFPGGLGEGVPGAFGFPSSPANSDEARKKDQVLAVPDARTSSLVVRAPSSLMPQIARLLDSLDGYPGRKETVQIFELQNAHPQQVEQVLRELFNRKITARNAVNSQQEDALAMRQQQQQNIPAGGAQGRGIGGQSSGFGSGGAQP